MKNDSHAKNTWHVLCAKTILLLFVLLMLGSAVSLMGYDNDGTTSEVASVAVGRTDDTGELLTTFNRSVAVGLLIAGAMIIIYCVKTSSKTVRGLGRCDRVTERRARKHR